MKKFLKNKAWLFAVAVCLGLSFAPMNSGYAEEEAETEDESKDDGAVDAAAAEAKDGKAIFMAYKCNKCHPIASAAIERTSKSKKMEADDLGGIVAEAERDWVVKWMKKEVENKEGKKHKKAFKGTPEQMEIVIDWLREQKKAP